MPKVLTLLLAGFIGGILAVVGLAAVTPKLTTSLTSAVSEEDKPAKPQVYGSR